MCATIYLIHDHHQGFAADARCTEATVTAWVKRKIGDRMPPYEPKMPMSETMVAHIIQMSLIQQGSLRIGKIS